MADNQVNWRSRRVKSGQIRAGELIPHPDNPKVHPQKQRDAVAGSISDLGQIAPILININNNYLVDGHERAWQALQEGEDTLVDADWVDLSEDEHRRALLILDAVGQLFQYDRDNLDALLRDVNTDDNRLSAMLSELAKTNGLIPYDKDSVVETNVIGGLLYKVILDCDSELHQSELLERFASEGLKCQALIS